MNPENNEIDINNQTREAENLPELKAAFDAINKMNNGEIAEVPIEEEEVSFENERPEEDASEENDDNEEVENLPIQEKKSDKYRKLQKDKYRALAEKEEALQRAAALEEMLKESLSSGTYHYGKNVYAELDRATEDKRRAFEEGDFDAYHKADIALIKSVNAISELERWASENEVPSKVQNRKQSSNFQDQNVNESDSLYDEIARDWVDSHPYLQPHSRNYNSKLAGDVANFVNELDNNLYRNRQEEVIFSEDYFDTIDNYIYSLNTPKRDNSKYIESVSNVSGVRNSSSAGRPIGKSSNEQVTLSKDEKRMAENAGISAKEWLKFKLNDIK